MVNSMGDPVIADFGVSRIVEDITGVPFSQSNGVSDSYRCAKLTNIQLNNTKLIRWFAPELCMGPGLLSTSSDVYAFAMTMLEVRFIA